MARKPAQVMEARADQLADRHGWFAAARDGAVLWHYSEDVIGGPAAALCGTEVPHGACAGIARSDCPECTRIMTRRITSGIGGLGR